MTTPEPPVGPSTRQDHPRTIWNAGPSSMSANPIPSRSNATPNPPRSRPISSNWPSPGAGPPNAFASSMAIKVLRHHHRRPRRFRLAALGDRPRPRRPGARLPGQPPRPRGRGLLSLDQGLCSLRYLGGRPGWLVPSARFQRSPRLDLQGAHGRDRIASNPATDASRPPQPRPPRRMARPGPAGLRDRTGPQVAARSRRAGAGRRPPGPGPVRGPGEPQRPAPLPAAAPHRSALPRARAARTGASCTGIARIARRCAI